MEVGDIYELGKVKKRYRILMFDLIYMYFETFELGKWSVSDHINRKTIFGGHGVDAFLARSPEFIENMKYTSDQRKIIRPDLPISIARNKEREWSDVGDSIFNFNTSILGDIKVESRYLYLFTKGPKGGRVGPYLIESNKNTGFTEAELVEKAAILQNKEYKGIVDGMGIFRVGLFKRVPLYAIDNYYLGGNIYYEQYEHNYNWIKHYGETENRK